MAGSDDDSGVYARAYELLRRRARALMSAESSGHTLQPTALVHEAYLRLAETDDGHWQSREHFLAIASRAMRRVLIDHARTRTRQKRGEGWRRVTLDPEAGFPDVAVDLDPLELIHLDRVLSELEVHHDRLGRVVEMKLFGGLTNQEIAAGLEVSLRTVEGDWAFARRWLAAALRPEDEASRNAGGQVS